MSNSSKKTIEQDVSATDHMASSNEIGRGYLTGPGLHEFPVSYAVVGDLAIHEGCIELGTVEEVEAEAKRIRAAHQLRNTTEAAAADDAPDTAEEKGIGLPTTSSFLWTDGMVPYTIAGDVPDPGRVDAAIQHIEEMTAIRFVKRTAANAQRYPNWVEIISNGTEGWSSSSIGMRGGRQVIRFSDLHSWPILVHEGWHALGAQHEQCRSDRDEFVEIRWDNIQDDAIGNFQKKPGSVDYFDYDYGSLMHYGATNFAKDHSKPVIVPLQTGVTIGQRNGLSFGDRQTIAKMYERFFQRGYAGVWRSGTGPYGLWAGAEWDSFKAKWQQWSNQGLRLHDIHVRRSGARTLYSGVFLPGRGSHALWANVDWESFKAKWQEWSSQGLRLVDFHVHRQGDQNRYSGAFLPGTGSHGLWANVNWESFKQKWQEWSAQGLRLVNLHVHRVDGQTRYSGVFLPGTGGHALWADTTWSSFVSKWKELTSQGLRLVDLNLHHTGDSIRYSGVFLPGTDGHYLWANVTYESLRAKWQELAEQGLRLIDFEVANAEEGAADVSDVSLANQDAVYPPGELVEFGGVFGYEASNKSIATEGGAGGTGMGGEMDGEFGTLPDIEDSGGAYFASQTAAEKDHEQQGLGGAFFEDNVLSAKKSSTEPDGHGGAVLAGATRRM